MHEKVVRALRKIKKMHGEDVFINERPLTGILADELQGQEGLMRENIIFLVKIGGYTRLKQAMEKNAINAEALRLIKKLNTDKKIDKRFAEEVVSVLVALFADTPISTELVGNNDITIKAKSDSSQLFTKAIAQNAAGDISIPYGYTEIEPGAFALCDGLTGAKIPESVAVIGEGAFSECRNLKSVILPTGLKTINAHTFSSCAGLINIEIPDGVTSIGMNAFGGCGSLASVIIPESVTSIGENAFFSCKNLAILMIPPSVYNIGSGALSGCDNLVVQCKENSYAHRYCTRMHIKTILV